MSAPRSYSAAALYGFDLDRKAEAIAAEGALESYEIEEDRQREREELEGERDGEFTYPCPLRDLLE